MALAAACLAFMARQFSTDIVWWATQKLQPGEEKLKQVRVKPVRALFYHKSRVYRWTILRHQFSLLAISQDPYVQALNRHLVF